MVGCGHYNKLPLVCQWSQADSDYKKGTIYVTLPMQPALTPDVSCFHGELFQLSIQCHDLMIHKYPFPCYFFVIFFFMNLWLYYEYCYTEILCMS